MAAAGFAAAITFDASAKQELGLNVHQSADVGLDVTRDAGIGWVRIDFNWLDVEPVQGAPNFAVMDALVDAARTRGLSVLATIGYGPPWASSGDAKADGTLNDVPIDGAYGAFVGVVVAHFQDRVSHFELWNEPNLSQFFEGSVDDYLARVLVPGADAVHATCPSCKVVGPAIATIGDGYDAFLDRVLADAGPRIDVLSGHVYAGFPSLGGGGFGGDSFLEKLEAHRVVKVGDTVAFEGPLSLREVMMKRGATQPLWITETGNEASLADAAALADQAAYSRHVLEAMLPRPWWAATIFYEAFDEPASGYTWGVTVHEGASYTKKPAFDVLKDARAKQKRFGGASPDCADGLDEDLDGLVDWPDDPDCDSALDQDEGILGGSATSSGNGGAGGGHAGGGPPGGASPEASSCAWDPTRSASSSPLAWLGVSAALVAARQRVIASRTKRDAPRRRAAARPPRPVSRTPAD